MSAARARRWVPGVRLAVVLLASGLLVGTVVAVASSVTSAAVCPSPYVAGSGSCYRLVETLAIRAGLVAGAATVIMALLVAGLVKMAAQDDRDRATRAQEAYLASRSAQ